MANRITVRLGSTGIVVDKNSFGALPVQRIATNAAVHLLHKAKDGGMTLFDTARFYTDSEEKLGKAFAEVRHEVVITTKTMAQNIRAFWDDLYHSLESLQTDYIDVYQFHNPDFCPKPDDGSGLYEAMLSAKEKGYIRHIGITCHKLSVAREAINSGLYETLQFPLSYLSSPPEEELVAMCAEKNMGFLAMKALAGGLINNAVAAYAYMSRFENVTPLWGIQKESELDEFLDFIDNPPAMTEELQAFIEHDRNTLRGDFCRGCGYCMPCPAGIEINNCARMSQLIRRSPSRLQLLPSVQEKMKRIENCIHCNQCMQKCPYHLDTPALLLKNYIDYQNILSGKTIL